MLEGKLIAVKRYYQSIKSLGEKPDGIAYYVVMQEVEDGLLVKGFGTSVLEPFFYEDNVFKIKRPDEEDLKVLTFKHTN